MPKMTKVFGAERTNLLYAIIGYVLNEGYVTVAELAEHFDYTEEEIVEAALSIGVAETGGGDYVGMPLELNFDALEDERIVEFVSYQVDIGVPRLTTKQTAALSAGLQILAQIPEFEYSNDVRELQAALHGTSEVEVDAIQVDPQPLDREVFIIREAILNSVAISCDYRNSRGEVTTGRVIEPLRLESRDQQWYLRGFCLRSGEVRVFKLDAMDHAILTAQPIDPAHKELPLSDQLFEPAGNTVTVTIEVDPEANAVLAAYQATVLPTRKHGPVLAEIEMGSLTALAPMVASYGGAVRVVAPAEARAVVRDYALRALGKASEATIAGEG